MRLISGGAALTLVAVAAVCMALAASASAAECPGTGEGVVLCSGGHVLEGTFAFTGKKKAETGSEIEVTGIMKLTCGTSTSKGQFVATKAGVEVTNLVIENPNCSLSGHAGCKVKPLIYGVGSGLRGTLASPGEITLSPMSGSVFTEISVTGCEQAYSSKVTGHQICSLRNSTVEAEKHEQGCATTGSKLSAGEKAVHVSFTEEIALSSGKPFSLQRG